jgi:hypothetical protein
MNLINSPGKAKCFEIELPTGTLDVSRKFAPRSSCRLTFGDTGGMRQWRPGFFFSD